MSAKMMCGGLADAENASEEIQKICDIVKCQVEKKSGKTYNVFIAKSCKKQVVAGTNYFIKVHLGGDDHIHLRIFQGLPHAGGKLELISIKESMKLTDEIDHF
ncbi:cystatin-B-like [Stigmatopora argus]